MPYTTHSRRLPRSRTRHTVSSKAPLTHSQRKERTARTRKRRDEINEEVREWKASTLKLATDLARRFKKKPRYFLDHFFQGGVHLVTKQGKVNPYNAFLAMKSSELRLSKYLIIYTDLFYQLTCWKMGRTQPSKRSTLPSTQRSTRILTKKSLMKLRQHTRVPLLTGLSARLQRHVYKMFPRLLKRSVTW
jgi:hypothetical protein